MKRIFFLLVSVFTTLIAMGGNVTADRAEAIARQFLSLQHHSAQGKRMTMAARQTLPMSVAMDATAYYVFNVGDNEGFVLVSGSDLAPQVLGYAQRGSFDEGTIPANMKAWLDGYADQIAYLERTNGRYQAAMPRKNAAALTPLLASTWNQDAPYNNLCPSYNGNKTYTGCVATAMAQVINYYKYPAQTQAPIPAYTTSTYGIDMPEIPITNIDWNNARQLRWRRDHGAGFRRSHADAALWPGLGHGLHNRR